LSAHRLGAIRSLKRGSRPTKRQWETLQRYWMSYACLHPSNFLSPPIDLTRATFHFKQFPCRKLLGQSPEVVKFAQYFFHLSIISA
jgi:hypothetical protein